MRLPRYQLNLLLIDGNNIRLLPPPPLSLIIDILNTQ